MKTLHLFLRWGSLYLLVILMIGLAIWENGLPISPIDHTLLLIGILGVFFFSLNSWITHHDTNFLVSQTYLEKMESKSRNFELQEGKEAQLEKTK